MIRFNSKANLSLAILGSVRAIRDYTEGPSLLHPVLQEGFGLSCLEQEAYLSRACGSIT